MSHTGTNLKEQHSTLLVDYLEAAFKILAALHEILDVVDIGEIDLEGLKELGLTLGQVGVGQQTAKHT